MRILSNICEKVIDNIRKIKSVYYSLFYKIFYDERKCYEELQSLGYEFKEADLLFEEPLLEGTINFSFIVPVYNAEKYLRKCIDSLLTQRNYTNYEIICVNDGSTDGSLGILVSYGNRIKVINQENQGIASSRNNGILQSRGKYIILVDNDDIVSDDFLWKVSLIIQNTDADIVQSSYTRIDEQGKYIGETLLDNYIADSVTRDIINKTRGYIWGCAIKRTLFDNIKFPSGFWYEDMITKMALLRFCSKIVTVSDKLYSYRVHSLNASKTIWKSRNIKAVDQFWLAVQLNEYCNKYLEKDTYSYCVLLGEFGNILWWRIRDFDFKTKALVFFLAGRYLRMQKPNCPLVLSSQEQKVEQALSSGLLVNWLNLFEK